MVKVEGHWVSPNHVSLVTAVNGHTRVYLDCGHHVYSQHLSPDEVVVKLGLATPGFSKDLPTPQTKVHKTVDQLLQEHPNLMTAVKVLLDAVMVTPPHASSQTLADWDLARKQ